MQLRTHQNNLYGDFFVKYWSAIFCLGHYNLVYACCFGAMKNIIYWRLLPKDIYVSNFLMLHFNMNK